MLIQLLEHQSFPRVQLSPQMALVLQEFDEHHARKHDGETIFDWKYHREIKAKNWVGVIQIAELTIEILPKISDVNDKEVHDTWRRNLLFMLWYSGSLPFSLRDIASLTYDRLPILELFIALFSEAALTELRNGVDRSYIHIEEESSFIKGKLIIAQQMRAGPLRQHRFCVAYDNFVSDTWINRIIKYTCQYLNKHTNVISTQQKLREINFVLNDVKDVSIKEHDFRNVLFNRANSRYKALIEFCNLIISGFNPNLASGPDGGFSLLFPMETVFESFIATYIKRNARSLGFKPQWVQCQFRGRNRHLLMQLHNSGTELPRVPIRPDVVIQDDLGNPLLILDTKWKKLALDHENYKNNVSMSDIYQVYSYAHHFDCPNNILLYPARDNVSNKKYLLSSDREKCLYTRQVDLDFDLMNKPDRLYDAISTAIGYT